ncbi:hypothetical protein [Catelliglobosispora koreensis]|uniref:hypothetical protein n=1 Tax=Catelliglobosispora koreensis TaxID=129052 RepID=UPI0003649884|nr:hypothetical protein [Catelliglobosispora koreensis]
MSMKPSTLRLRSRTVTITPEHRPGGTMLYRLAGPSVTGVVSVEPWATDTQAVPDRWAVNLGTGSPLANHRDDLPVIDTVTLYGGGGPLQLSHSGFWARLRIYVKQGGAAMHTSPQLLDAKRTLFAVLKHIGEMHCQHDPQPLLHEAARHNIMRRLARAGHNLLATYRLYAETRDELATRTALVRDLQALSPLRLLHTPPARWHGCVDPDVYLRADDNGDWLTCPACEQPITRLEGGDRLGSLLQAVTGHRCP